MTEPTLTMLMRKRLVTLEEAKRATQRLINSHYAYSEGDIYSIPAHVKDDDIVATDYLHQLEMPPEQLVKMLRPRADLYGGHHCKVWIQDGGEMLSGIQCHGTREQRNANAWASALKALERRL